MQQGQIGHRIPATGIAQGYGGSHGFLKSRGRNCKRGTAPGQSFKVKIERGQTGQVRVVPRLYGLAEGWIVGWDPIGVIRLKSPPTP
jgi:hypothetical protein